MTHDHATLVRLPLDAQAEKLGRILDQRVAHYRRAVRLGRRPLEWGALKHAECEDIRRSFAWLLTNHDWIKAEDHQRNAIARFEREQADHEAAAIAEIMRVFPDAQVVSPAISAPEPA